MTLRGKSVVRASRPFWLGLGASSLAIGILLASWWNIGIGIVATVLFFLAWRLPS